MTIDSGKGGSVNLAKKRVEDDDDGDDGEDDGAADGTDDGEDDVLAFDNAYLLSGPIQHRRAVQWH